LSQKIFLENRRINTLKTNPKVLKLKKVEHKPSQNMSLFPSDLPYHRLNRATNGATYAAYVPGSLNKPTGRMNMSMTGKVNVPPNILCSSPVTGAKKSIG
jgi:hypothetical protein